MKPIFHAVILLLSIIYLTSCPSGNTDPFSKCKYGKPAAIFEGQFVAVDSQQFVIAGMSGVEQVWFENGMRMELIQDGCNKIRQTFQFELPGQFEETENWILLAASQFQYLSSISEKHFELGMWGQAIQQQSSSLFLGERIMLQPGFFVKINKVRGVNYATLIVELSEE